MMQKDYTDRLKQVRVYLEFDRELQNITGTNRTEIVMSDGTPFSMFLYAVLETYTAITQVYHSSSIGFSLNGEAPELHDLLHDRDTVSMVLTGNRNHLWDFYRTGKNH